MTELLILILSFVLPTITVVAYFPQLSKAYKTKHTRDVSLGIFALIATSAALWVLYDILKVDVVVIITNSLILVVVGLILSMKLRYG